MFQKSLEKMRKNEGGFTLIELLVVMIIIGLLAMIAIPVFLNQKDKARDSAVQSDLRNAAIVVETTATDIDGTYVVPENNEFGKTENVSVTMTLTGGEDVEGEFVADGGYCLAGSWGDDATNQWYLPSGGSVTKDAC